MPDDITAIRVGMKRAVYARQKNAGPVSRFKGERVLRAGKVSLVKSASSKRVQVTMEATGRLVSMSSKAFLSRGVLVLHDDEKIDVLAKPTSIQDRAHGIAVATELSTVRKILMLNQLKREAKGEKEKEAIEWYLVQLRTGVRKMKRWPGGGK